MKKFISAIILSLFLVLLFVPSTGMASYENQMLRVGLFYGDSALATANLENSVGSGYRFGYLDSSDRFVHLGTTNETQISMLKTQNIYLKDNVYYSNNPGGSYSLIGCYHIQLSGTYASFDQAKAAAGKVSNAFPAWISGSYVVRVGAYGTKTEAQSAQGNLGQSGTTIVGTSSYGISVTKTKTTTILFQFDSGGSQIFTVNPGANDSTKTVTWFKGYKYYGDFSYERIGGGNLTVSNFLSMDDYIKGVIPYEMSASWPLEALKAQSVCARNYALSSSGSRHTSHHFDVCNTTCCQVYRGLNSANDNSNRAVDETSGVCAWYNGKLVETYYYASNGGASEDVRNVWSSSANLPYLCGVIDPYEQTIESSIPGYRWSTSFTSAGLTSLLQSKGYNCSTIVDLKVTQYTDKGNVFSISFVDSNGTSFDFSRERVRTILGLKSMRFNINGSGPSGNGSYYVDENGKTLPDLSGVWTIGDGGEKSQLKGSSGHYAITDSGTEALPSGGGASGGGGSSTPGIFTINGSGNGHNIGMSQWGAYAMAKQGFTYDQILKFYYVGIDLY